MKGEDESMKYLWSEREYELTPQNCIWDPIKCAFKVCVNDVKIELRNHHYAVLGDVYLVVEDITLYAAVVAECFFTVVDGDTDPDTYLSENVVLSDHDLQVLTPWLTF